MSDRRAPAAVVLLVVAVLGCSGPEVISTPLPRETGNVATPSTSPTRVPTTPATTMNPEPSMPAAPPGDVYAVPDPLPPAAPGTPIWAERVAAPEGAVAWRVLYHSRSIRDEDIAVSGLVVVPDREPPPGGFPVIAYAHGTTGLADSCAPSRRAEAVRDGAAAGARGDLPLPPFWDAGYVVAATDYEGLGTPGPHPYLVGGSEARGVLDSIRAARAMAQAHAGEPAVVVGISQGGHAALFTGELAHAYAPDAGLRGVVALAPGAELAQAAMLLMGDPTVVGFGVAIGHGFAAAHPDLRLDEVLTPRALAAIDVIETGCIDDILDAYAGPATETLRLERLMQPPWPALLDENTPGRAPTPVPILVGQGEADPLVIPELTDALVARLCAIGNDVTYRRYPGESHSGVVEASQDDVLEWIGELVAGRPTGTAGDECPG
jgi:alpha-beta hydrolase superfamily lysophospholipase